MTKGLDKKIYATLALGLLFLLLCAIKIERANAYGLLSGYVLFSINFLLLTKIYGALVLSMKTGQKSARLKTGLLLGRAIKFVGLIAALFALIVLWDLPGLYIEVGSLLSLFLLTGLLLSSYVKSFSSTSAP